ncbi:hypothetical protein GCM10023188_34780 [Pontibacter saemangeumensis]|uniref:VPDSG-CTERM protein sorting domain-containing protein n=1 Tax=Pontibacter saemangeumensis TaxID=1084525 RepID=A0ABP8LWY6_9BACT
MKNLLIKSFILIAVLFITGVSDVAAQRKGNGIPPGKNKPGNPGTSTGVPIDGGASVLLAAGAAYGLKKLRDYRKNNMKNDHLS